MPEQPHSKLSPAAPLDPPTEVAPCVLDYAELSVTTNFSFLQGASHPDELVYTAATLGYRAIAVTDHNSLAGIVRAHEAAGKPKLKLVTGARLIFQDAPDLLVWAMNRNGYARLCRLLTLGRRRAPKGECHLVLQDFLDGHHEGLMAGLVPGPDLSSRDLRADLDDLHDALGDRLSIVASVEYGPDEEGRLEHLIDLGRRAGIPLVATNDVHYHDPGRRPLQDVLTCIRHGCTIAEAGYRLFANNERHLKSPEEMHRLFRAHPQAIRRIREIVGRCTFTLDELRYEYPDEVVPPGMTMTQYLREETYRGAAARYPHGIPEKVGKLLEKELTFIAGSKYEPYFLTVHDLVRYARSRGILCQGRGSAANSAVCYCLGVTSVDPATFQLVFERFASAARNEPPDIDIDFEHERREEVLQYVYEKYGRHRAGMTAVVITYRGRSAIRDVGKALGMSSDRIDQMAKRLHWWDRGVLSPEQFKEAGVDPTDKTVLQWIHLTSQLLGFPRHLSQHVGGMVITRGSLSGIVPIENASMEDRTVIEWDKDDIDVVGLFKVDCLGLGMLTCISKAMDHINNRHGQPKTCHPERSEGSQPLLTQEASRSFGVPQDDNGSVPRLQLHTIPDADPAVYDMISDADTIGVFQVESRAQMTMLPRLRPRCFYDLVIEVAIVRPGPIQGNMVHPYLRRRNGEEKVTYPSEELREVLEKTLGVPLFQEQAMQLAVVAAGFTPEEADELRRSMASWKRVHGMSKFHGKFVNGMLARGYDRTFAEQCFEQINGFGEYGFPESHSASFARLVYVSAWLKRYYPAAFACALLNSQPMGFYAPAQLVRDAVEHGVEARDVDVNASEWECTLEESDEATERRSDEGKERRTYPQKWDWGVGGPALRLGFRRVKGLSEAHARQLVEVRKKRGPFKSIAQLHSLTRLPKHVLKRLAEADAFGSLGLTRRRALWEVLELADEEYPLFEQPSTEMYSPFVAPSDLRSALRRSVASDVALPDMPLQQEVLTDYATTGHSLKLHPVALVREQLKQMKVITAQQLAQMPHGRWVKVAGLVLIRQRPGTASGIVFETLEDETGISNLIVRPHTFDAYRSAACHAALLAADGYVERQGQVVHVMVKRLYDLSSLIRGYSLESRDFH